MMPWDSVLKILDTAITRIWPDKTEQEKMQLMAALQSMQAEYDNAAQQLEVNKVEAASSDTFVSGWRPFIGWVCGFSLAYKFIFYPFIIFLCALSKTQIEVSIIPVIDTGELMPILLGILGLGAMRTYEKYKGVAK
jgi:hypothetical protein